MGKFIYFAYGSNMLTERLQKRCPSAKSIGTAIAHGYYLSFGKRSKDKSGKATLENAVGMLGQDVIGVIFEIDLGERENLDNAEGDGYRRDDAFLVIRSDSGEETSASVYIAKEVVTGLIPYDWYHALILIGAIQNKLPTQYISALYNVPFGHDFDLKRETRMEALTLFNLAGHNKTYKDIVTKKFNPN